MNAFRTYRLLLSLHLLQTFVSSEYLKVNPFWHQVIISDTDPEFIEETTKVANHASSLRDGNLSSSFNVNYVAGYNGLIGKLCFEDGLCWAAKFSMQKYPYNRLGMKHAIRSLEAIASFCPNLRVPRVYGHSNDQVTATFIYYFMDWIEGGLLMWNISKAATKLGENGSTSRGYEVNLTIAEKYIVQLASFVYNLTTCAIPDDRSIPQSIFGLPEIVVSSSRSLVRLWPTLAEPYLSRSTQIQPKSDKILIDWGNGHEEHWSTRLICCKPTIRMSVGSWDSSHGWTRWQLSFGPCQG